MIGPASGPKPCATNQATNFYIRNSEDAAHAFFSDQPLDRVTGLYGIRPTIQYAELAALVDNARDS